MFTTYDMIESMLYPPNFNHVYKGDSNIDKQSTDGYEEVISISKTHSWFTMTFKEQRHNSFTPNFMDQGETKKVFFCLN